jgi:hypothetical protein
MYDIESTVKGYKMNKRYCQNMRENVYSIGFIIIQYNSVFVESIKELFHNIDMHVN